MSQTACVDPNNAPRSCAKHAPVLYALQDGGAYGQSVADFGVVLYSCERAETWDVCPYDFPSVGNRKSPLALQSSGEFACCQSPGPQKAAERIKGPFGDILWLNCPLKYISHAWLGLFEHSFEEQVASGQGACQRRLHLQLPKHLMYGRPSIAPKWLLQLDATAGTILHSGYSALYYDYLNISWLNDLVFNILRTFCCKNSWWQSRNPIGCCHGQPGDVDQRRRQDQCAGWCSDEPNKSSI